MAELQLQGLQLEELDKLLANVEVGLRRKAMKAAHRKAARLVIKEATPHIPKEGYTGTTTRTGRKYKDQKRPGLRKSLGVKIKEYQGGRIVVAMVGARVSGKHEGRHFHLFEEGFQIKPRGRGKKSGLSDTERQSKAHGPWPRVKAKKVLSKAVDGTRGRQEQMIRDTLADYFREASR